jgi:hypothetical protein
MDDLDRLQEDMERIPPITFRAMPQDQCRVCLTTMASHLLEEGLCIDCWTLEG